MLAASVSLGREDVDWPPVRNLVSEAGFDSSIIFRLFFFFFFLLDLLLLKAFSVFDAVAESSRLSLLPLLSPPRIDSTIPHRRRGVEPNVSSCIGRVLTGAASCFPNLLRCDSAVKKLTPRPLTTLTRTAKCIQENAKTITTAVVDAKEVRVFLPFRRLRPLVLKPLAL